MITVIAKLPIKEGKMEEALGEFKALMSKIAKEEGTVLYSLNKEKSNPNNFIHPRFTLKNFLPKVPHLSRENPKLS